MGFFGVALANFRRVNAADSRQLYGLIKAEVSGLRLDGISNRKRTLTCRLTLASLVFFLSCHNPHLQPLAASRPSYLICEMSTSQMDEPAKSIACLQA